MANKKFSDFVEKTNENEVDFVVGYSGGENVRIDPSVLSGTTDYNDLTNKPTIPTNNLQLLNGAGYVTTDTNTQRTDQDIRDVIATEGYLTTETDSQTLSISGNDLSINNGNTVTLPDTNTQLSDSDIAAMGYIKTDANTQLSDSDIAAFGYIKTDANTQRTDSEIQAIIDANTAGYLTNETDSQTLSFSSGSLSISNGNAVAIPDTNTQLSDADITAMGYIKTDTNTQLSDSDIASFGYIKTDTNTQLSDSDISALGYIKTDTNTQLNDADITALGYIKTDTNTQRTDQEIKDVISTEGYITSETSQTLSISGQDLTLSGGGGTVTIPSGGGGGTAFQHQVLSSTMYHSANTIGDVYWWSFDSSNEATNNPNYDNFFAPYGDGRIKFITLVHNQSGLNPQCDGVKFWYKKVNTETLIGTATVTNAGSYGMTSKYELTDSELTFTFGDSFAFGFETVVSGAQTGKFYGGWANIGIEYT